MFIYRTPDANTDSASSTGPDATANADANQTGSGTSLDQTAGQTDGEPKGAWEFVQKELAAKHGLESEPNDQTDNADPNAPSAQADDTASSLEADREKAARDAADKGKPDGKAASETEKDKDKSNEGVEKPPPFHKHPAWQKREAELKELREKQTQLDEQLKDLRDLEDFSRKNNIGNKQLAEALNLLALINSDTAKARGELQKVMDQLSTISGDKLPEDLAKRAVEIENLVAEKVLDPETGNNILENIKETARLRAEKTFGTEQGKRTAQQQAADVAAASIKALNDWDTTMSKKDPDFSAKKEMVQDAYIVLMQTEGRPTNPQAAVVLAEKALARVNKFLEKTSPRPARRRSSPTSNGSSTNSVKEQPKTAVGYVSRMLSEKHGIDLDTGSDED